MKKISFLFLIFVLFSCNSTTSTTSSSKDNYDGFEQEKWNDGIVMLVKYNDKRVPLETGMTKNGVKNGIWTTNYKENGRMKTMTTYVDGKKNGVYLEFNNRGQIESKSHYVNDLLNGFSGEYKFGRTEMLCKYKNGVLDGDYKEYFKSGAEAGNLAKLVQFKNGKQDGKLAYYNAEGVVMQEYLYKNGERVGK